MNRLLTPKELSEYLAVKPATVYQWVKQRKIPHVVLSRGSRKNCIRFRQEEIERWILQRLEKPQRGSG